jgi:20S proteasome alpha/beta subunit
VTVVLALKNADGIVMAADTQITQNDVGMTFPAQKLRALGEHAAWGGSGARAVQLDLAEIFEEQADAITAAHDVSKALQERVLPVLKHHYENFIPEIPGEPEPATPSAYVVAAGYSQEQPFIVEINPNGMVSRYEDIGFHAVGSGAPMAQQAGVLLSHFRMPERTVDFGVVAVIRVLDALALVSPSVGGPLDIFRITPEDGAHHLDDDEIAEGREHAERWRDLEEKALDKLF